MEKIKQYGIAIGLMVALVGFAPAALAQEDYSPAPEADAEQMIQEQSVSGELTSVDHDNQTLMVTTAEGLELEFSYDDQTEFIGAQDTIEGLSTSAGSQVEVFYREDAGRNLATRIHVQPSEDLTGSDQQETQPVPDEDPQWEPAPSPEPDQYPEGEPLPGPEGLE
jgi:hypothetical protein